MRADLAAVRGAGRDATRGAGGRRNTEPRKAPTAAGPYIDTPLCTSRNECITLNGRLFVYDANQQATIGDASAGSFKQLVMAAEKCPARCIHPGAPRPGDKSATAALIARAQPFA